MSRKGVSEVRGAEGTEEDESRTDSRLHRRRRWRLNVHDPGTLPWKRILVTVRWERGITGSIDGGGLGTVCSVGEKSSKLVCPIC
jgi:hypothetical protein